MNSSRKPLRVLHSFPHRLGKPRICTTAWYEIASASDAGADLTVYAGDSVRPFKQPVAVHKTLSYGKFRIPYKLLGTFRACGLHDWIVARNLYRLKGKIDIIHAWPLGALRTMRAAKTLRIPVALERCNAHTRFAYEVVQQESSRIGVALPKNHEHAYKPDVLKLEEKEYALADGILCPSDFVVKTFRNYGYPDNKLTRFFYGVDPQFFYPSTEDNTTWSRSLSMIFVGVCAVRKGLHYALEAWLKSPACQEGKFLIAGDFLPEYRSRLSRLIQHPSIEILGHRNDIPALMRKSDLFILPSIEEGFGLVCTEAIASGCVPLVSDACTDLCRHMVNALVHPVGDVEQLSSHITLLHNDRALLTTLRKNGLQGIENITWQAAGKSLVSAYQEIIQNYRCSST